MKLGLKEIGAVAVLATAGCTSPDLEDNKNETHPVCAVSDIPDAHSDTVTEEMVKAVRTECATINVQEQSEFIGEHPHVIRGDAAAGYFKLAEFIGERAEEECLALHGLGEAEPR